MLSVAHDTITGGHLGRKRTKEKIMSNFYWPGMYEDAARCCRSCDVCKKTASKRTLQKIPMTKYQWWTSLSIAWLRISFDR